MAALAAHRVPGLFVGFRPGKAVALAGRRVAEVVVGSRPQARGVVPAGQRVRQPVDSRAG